MHRKSFLLTAALFIGTLFLAGCGGGGGGGGSQFPSDLVAYWPANGNYNDVVGGNNGIPIGGVGFATGENGQAFSLDGSTGRVFVPDNTSLALTHSLAITAWIKVTAYPSSASYILFRGDDRIGTDPYNMYILSDGRLGMNISNDVNVEAQATSATSVPLNTWTYVSCSLDDSTGVESVYINGTLEGTNTTALRPFAQLDPTENPGVGIGNVQSANYSFYFDGLIDELKLYNSAAPAAAPPSP